MATATRNAEVEAVRDVPLDDGRFLEIRGEPVWVGALSLDQLTALLHYARRVVRIADRDRVLVLIGAAQASTEEDQQRVLANQIEVAMDLILEILTKEQVAELVGILLDRDVAWVSGKVDGRPRITLPTLAAIAQAVVEFNDPREILAVFGRAWQTWMSRVSTADSSAPSSD